jgi:hypothetical protein
MNDIEARLQAALSARAEQVTADSLRPGEPPAPRAGAAVRARVRGRLPRWGTPLAAAAAALLVIAVGGFLSTRTGPAPQAAAITVDGVAFRPPAGWVYRSVSEGVGCVQPDGTPQRDGECVPVGVEIRVGEFVGWPRNALDSDDGWSFSRACSTSTSPAPRLLVVSNKLVESDTRPVGGRTGDYRVWRVRCEAGVNFTVRLWWLPDLSVAVYSVALDSSHDSTVDRFVSALDVTGARPRVTTSR